MMRQSLCTLLTLLMLCAGCGGQVPDVSQEDVPAATLSAPAEAVPSLSQETPVTSVPSISSAPPAPQQLPLEGRIICIDPGHSATSKIGMGEQEAISPLSDETKPCYSAGTRGANLTEEQLNLTVSLQLRDALEALGAQVVMTRDVSDIAISNIERCAVAHEAGAEVAIHIHADGNNDSSVHGVSVLVPSGELLGTPSITQESRRLGELMLDAIIAETGAKNRGISPRSDLVSFNFSQIPTVLIEMGFMTNPEEDALLGSPAYQAKIIDGIVTSLLQWYQVNH